MSVCLCGIWTTRPKDNWPPVSGQLNPQPTNLPVYVLVVYLSTNVSLHCRINYVLVVYVLQTFLYRVEL